MKFLYDLFPLLLFFVGFRFFDIFVATAIAIAASVAQVTIYWLQHRRFEPMHLVTLSVVAIFGSLTLIFRDDTFIKWKPTIVYWLLGGFMMGNHLFSKRTMIARIIGSQVSLPDHVWRKLNLSWAIFFFALGALNLYVAFYYALDLPAAERQALWVKFKVFGLLGITFLFTIIQTLFLARHFNDPPSKNSTDPGA